MLEWHCCRHWALETLWKVQLTPKLSAFLNLQCNENATLR